MIRAYFAPRWRALKGWGARKAIDYSTHPVLSDTVIDNIAGSQLGERVVFATIRVGDAARNCVTPPAQRRWAACRDDPPSKVLESIGSLHAA
jgi:hypothetical protein